MQTRRTIPAACRAASRLHEKRRKAENWVKNREEHPWNSRSWRSAEAEPRSPGGEQARSTDRTGAIFRIGGFHSVAVIICAGPAEERWRVERAGEAGSDYKTV